MPYLTFLVQGESNYQLSLVGKIVNNQLITSTIAQKNAILVQTQLLKEMQLTLIPIALLLPLWLWFITSAVAIRSGSKNQKASYIDFGANVSQFIVLLLVNLVIARYLNNRLWLAVFLFYLSDIPKAIPYEYAYYKWNWSINITKNKTKVLQII